MKKANIKTKVIFWITLTTIALIVLILCSIIVHNASLIIETRKYMEFAFEIVNRANIEKSYAIGGLALSIVVILMGSYISYAGIKSWNYNAIL